MNRAFAAFLRLELSDALRSRWAVLTGVLYTALAFAFTWLGLNESTVIGFTGVTRVLLNLTTAMTVVCPLVVLLGTHAAITKARTNGFCELMLVQPVERGAWFSAVLAARVIILMGPFVAVLLASCAAALVQGEGGVAQVAAQSFGICASLVFAFIGIGLLISTAVQTVERAMVWALLVFVFSAAVHDMLLISVLLRTSLPPYAVFALAALNPTGAARVGILTSVDPELSALGPVGFWLANTLGPRVSLAVAVLWPLALGVGTTLAALRRTRRMDLVA